MEVLLGFAIALVVGMTGMGGGPLAAPLLMLVLKVPPTEAIGTSLLFVFFTKLAAHRSIGNAARWTTMR